MILKTKQNCYIVPDIDESSVICYQNWLPVKDPLSLVEVIVCTIQCHRYTLLCLNVGGRFAILENFEIFNSKITLLTSLPILRNFLGAWIPRAY